MISLTTHSPEQTELLGEHFAKLLAVGDLVALCGELGSGKTCFVRGIAKGLGVAAGEWVNSPTYTVVNQYQGPIPLYHFDFYRLNSVGDLDSTALPDYLSGSGALAEGVVVIEWANKFAIDFPEGCFWVKLSYNNDINSESDRQLQFEDGPILQRQPTWQQSLKEKF